MHDLLADLLQPIPVLDHGFVRLVDAMPRLVDAEGESADHAVVNAARVSYQQGTKTKRTDRGLIRYLMRHRHTSPFEMVELKFHAKMPIYIARQWVRHRTASINEISARYSVLPEEAYVPAPEDLAPQHPDNKQGRLEDPFPRASAEAMRTRMQENTATSFALYGALLEEGVARETARGVLPVSTFTEWYWKANLLNVLRFLHLRLDPHAQREIRVYAEAMATLVARYAPWTWEAFEDYWRDNRALSKPQWEALTELMTQEQREAWRAKLEQTLSPGELREWEALWS